MNRVRAGLLIIGMVAACCIASAQTGKQGPHLFFTAEKVALLKQRIQADTFIAANWNEILQQADGVVQGGNAKGKIDYLALVYLVTGKKEYAGKIKEYLLQLCSRPSWTDPSMMQRDPPWTSDLGTADNCWVTAIGYDAIRNVLTKEERNIITGGLVRMGILPALNDWIFPEKRIHSLNSMGHNWWSACVGMAGVAALAILEDEPRAAGWVETVNQAMIEWFSFNGDELHFKPRSWDEKGAMYESVNYAAFGVSEYLFFRLAWENTYPGKQAPVIPVLDKVPGYFMHVAYPRTGMLYSLNFGDGGMTAAGERPVKLLYAMGDHHTNNLWYLSQIEKFQHREGLFVNTPIGITYQPDMRKAPAVPDLSTSEIFSTIGWASLRNSWKKDATMLGVKSGYTWNHSHADANSFILFHKGEAIIKDPGNSGYGSDEYADYFFQSQAHNVILFNGQAQPAEQQYYGSPEKGHLSNLLDGGHIKYILSDATGPTSKNFTRNFRHYLWLDKVILVIDDVKTYNTGKFEWLLHPGGDARKTGMDISIQNNNAAVLVRPLFPETLIQTGYNHDFPEKMKLVARTAPQAKDLTKTETYFSIQYPEEVRQTKFVTAIILKDSVNDNNIPQIERITAANYLGLRIRQSGKVTNVYLNLLADGRKMHLNSCNNMGGWDTDAYLLALTWAENKDTGKPEDLQDLFVGYGSYVRKEQQVVYESLSKLSGIVSYGKNNIAAHFSGQPYARIGIFSAREPGAFSLNGKKTVINYQPSLFTFLLKEQ
ncbi:heparinase II/III family protein [Chitinophaga sp. OAE865]|uniref:heparinase II/III domain-containing protein n=1 Tax=Chitinophaga sp. OAE865 TaxID=2817898 RepID=UPI001AE2AC01